MRNICILVRLIVPSGPPPPFPESGLNKKHFLYVLGSLIVAGLLGIMLMIAQKYDWLVVVIATNIDKFNPSHFFDLELFVFVQKFNF